MNEFAIILADARVHHGKRFAALLKRMALETPLPTTYSALPLTRCRQALGKRKVSGFSRRDDATRALSEYHYAAHAALRALRQRKGRRRIANQRPGAGRHIDFHRQYNLRCESTPAKRMAGRRRAELVLALRQVCRRYARESAPQIHWGHPWIELEKETGWIKYRGGSRQGIVSAEYSIGAQERCPLPRYLHGRIILSAEPAGRQMFFCRVARQGQAGPVMDEAWVWDSPGGWELHARYMAADAARLNAC